MHFFKQIIAICLITLSPCWANQKPANLRVLQELTTVTVDGNESAAPARNETHTTITEEEISWGQQCTGWILGPVLIGFLLGFCLGTITDDD